MDTESGSRFIHRKREYHVRSVPNYDAVCFHSQQATEKYLKAVLHEKGKTVPHTHSLIELLALFVKENDDFLDIQSDAIVMEGYAIQFRYPSLTANKADAKTALLS